MSATTPEIEPTEFRAGDTVTWLKDVADYPPADGWTLKYAFRNASAKFNVTATTSGTRYLSTITAATSAAFTAAIYKWIAYVTKGAGASLEQHTVDEGTTKVLPCLSADANYDDRSDARKNYDYLLTMYRSCINVTSGNVVKYEINGRMMEYRKGDDVSVLRKELQYWAGVVAAEDDAERAGNGQPTKNVLRAVL